jgi:hypothetical protein
MVMDSSELQADRSAEPWTVRKEWAEGRIRGQTGSNALLLGLMALLWNGFMGALLGVVWGDPGRVDMLKVIMLFLALGLVLLGAAIVKAVAWLRFGSSVLELSTVPGVIGGSLEGHIVTRLARRPSAPVQLSLSCIRRRQSKPSRVSGGPGGTGRRVRTDVLWQGTRLVAPEELEPGPSGLLIPVQMFIPHGLESTDVQDSDDEILWELAATVDIPGVDFIASFAVPVFATETSDPTLTQARVDELTDRSGGFTRPADPGEYCAPPMLVQPTDDGGLRYTFSLGVTMKVAMAVSALALAVCAGSAALFVWLGRNGPFALVPGAFGLLLLFSAVVIWTFKSRVVVAGGAIDVRKSVLGIPRSWRVTATDLEAVTVKRDSGDWVILLERGSGPELNLGATFTSRADAQRVAADIERLMVL